MSGFDDWRDHPRVGVDGEAFWSGDREEGSCRLVNLSAGGVQICDPRPALRVGTQLRVSLIVNELRIESIPVEVVRLSEDALGLCFLKLTDELEQQLEALIRDVIAS